MSYRDGNEIVKPLDKYLVNALKKYKEKLGILPERIVMYCDGVGEGQIKVIKAQEIDPIMKTLQRIYGYEGKKPQFAYIVVNKSVNSRFFKIIGNQHANPRPGTGEF